MSIIQYGGSLDHLIIEVVIGDPAFGTFYVLKVDVRNGFYHIVLQPIEAPNMGLVFSLDESVH